MRAVKLRLRFCSIIKRYAKMFERGRWFESYQEQELGYYIPYRFHPNSHFAMTRRNAREPFPNFVPFSEAKGRKT